MIIHIIAVYERKNKYISQGNLNVACINCQDVIRHQKSMLILKEKEVIKMLKQNISKRHILKYLYITRLYLKKTIYICYFVLNIRTLKYLEQTQCFLRLIHDTKCQRGGKKEERQSPPGNRSTSSNHVSLFHVTPLSKSQAIKLNVIHMINDHYNKQIKE